MTLVLNFTAGMSGEQFRADRKTVDAVIRNLEIIGEAVKHLPASTRSAYANVDWRRIAGLRDVQIHTYFGVDLDIVWDVVTSKIEALLTAAIELSKQPGPKR